MGRKRKPAPNRTKPYLVCTRLSPADFEALERVCQKEKRQRGAVISWFIQWGMKQYDNAGSLVELWSTKTISSNQARLEDEMYMLAAQRLQVRAQEQRKEVLHGIKEGQGHHQPRKASNDR